MPLAIVSLANIFLFVLIDLIATKASPYIGILAYMVSPAFLVLGLVADARRASCWSAGRRWMHTAFYPRIDLNDPRTAQRGHFVYDLPGRLCYGQHRGQLQGVRIHRVSRSFADSSATP